MLDRHLLHETCSLCPPYPPRRWDGLVFPPPLFPLTAPPPQKHPPTPPPPDPRAPLPPFFSPCNMKPAFLEGCGQVSTPRGRYGPQNGSRRCSPPSSFTFLALFVLPRHRTFFEAQSMRQSASSAWSAISDFELPIPIPTVMGYILSSQS